MNPMNNIYSTVELKGPNISPWDSGVMTFDVALTTGGARTRYTFDYSDFSQFLKRAASAVDSAKETFDRLNKLQQAMKSGGMIKYWGEVSLREPGSVNLIIYTNSTDRKVVERLFLEEAEFRQLKLNSSSVFNIRAEACHIETAPDDMEGRSVIESEDRHGNIIYRSYGPSDSEQAKAHAEGKCDSGCQLCYKGAIEWFEANEKK